MPNKIVCLAGFCFCIPIAAGIFQSFRLLAEVDLLEFLLRLAEVLLVPVDRALPLSLSPFFWEKAVEEVAGESVELRYSASLSDVLVAVASVVL